MAGVPGPDNGVAAAMEWVAWFVPCLGRAVVRAEDSLASVPGKARVW